jgi:hypothetical protein
MSLARAAVGPLLALALLASVFPVDGQVSDDLRVPESLAEPAEDLRDGLTQVADADTIDEARQAHDDAVRGPADQLLLYASDLADRSGGLLATDLDRLDEQLAAGNLSDARSLASAGAQLVADDVQPVAERWDRNRTALAAGPVQPTEEGPAVALVLVNPPPGSIAAVDASLTLEAATPRSASLALGQGETTVDPANGTVRWASFDASAAASLATDGAQPIALGEARIDPTADTIATNVTVHDLLDADGQPTPAIGLASDREVPADGTGLPTTWLALGGVALGAVGLGWWVQRWEP